MFSIIERDKAISDEISDMMDYGTLNNNNYNNLLKTQKEIMDEFYKIKNSLDKVFPGLSNNTSHQNISHSDELT